MHYLLLGEDNLAKDAQIEKIKKQVLFADLSKDRFPDALNFDFQILYADKLTAEELKKTLVSLPVVAKQRLLIIRNIHKLSAQNKDLLLDFLEKNDQYAVIVCDTFDMEAKNAFFRKLSRFVKTVSFQGEAKQNVFEMTNAIKARRPQEALKVLNNLMAKGNHPLQLMGVLIWFWGKNKNRLTKDKFHQGLQCLQEADLNIKRSRMNAENAIELAVVKLCSLIAC